MRRRESCRSRYNFPLHNRKSHDIAKKQTAQFQTTYSNRLYDRFPDRASMCLVRWTCSLTRHIPDSHRECHGLSYVPSNLFDLVEFLARTRSERGCLWCCGFGHFQLAVKPKITSSPQLTLIPSLITLPCTNSCLSSLDSLHRKRYSQCSSRDFPVLFTDPDRCVWPNCYKGGAIYWVWSALSTTYCGRSLTPGITLGTLAGTRVNLLQPVIPEAERACLPPSKLG